MGVEVLNFGCRLNIAEGEAIRVAAGKVPLGNQQSMIVINSCAVTSEAERQARQAIRKAARGAPDARIVVTGCGADVSRERFAAMAEVSSVVANADKLLPKAYDRSSGAKPKDSFEQSREAQPRNLGLAQSSTATLLGMSAENAPAIPYAPLTSGATHARAFISVQNGCDHRCTFCIIPYGRGDSRSARVGDVVAACQAAVARGQQEVVLTGVDLTSYNDGGKPLGELVESILTQVPALPRLRLSSLDSVEIDPLLEEIITSEPRLMPHLHLSLQAGDDMILKRMKRRHSRAQSIALVQRLKAKRPELAIGADIIAGFPTETDDMFLNSLALVAECDLVFGHIFPYSPRHGTPAALMPQVAPALARVRAARLREAVALRKSAWLRSLVGSTQAVLVELDGMSGHAANFSGVVLDTKAQPKRIIPTLITSSDGTRLTGTPA